MWNYASRKIYDSKKDAQLNPEVTDKKNLFDYVNNSMIKDGVVTVFTGLAAIAGGSSLPSVQQDDPSMLGAYLLGTIAFAGVSIYSGISAYSKHKKLKKMDKELTTLMNTPDDLVNP